MMIFSDQLLWLGLGFAIGCVVCAVLVRSWGWFAARKLHHVSNAALLENSTRFMDLADRYFATYTREAKKDFDIKGDEILRTVEPVRQMLDKYEARLNTMEKDREKAFGSISERLMEIGRTQSLLSMETANLVKALRVPHVRGRWGENTLKRVAELAGMADHCDFVEQVSTSGGKGAVRPDMVVTLPENRKIVIDSKVPLMAYLDALEAPDEAQHRERMKEHGRQVMQHILNLSSKQYFEQISPSPEFVVLFIPGENFFAAALSVYPDLIEKGVEKGVILATPTTLIALLKAVSYSWKQKAGYENAEAIHSLGKELFSRLCSMTSNMNQLGSDIEKCVASYNRTAGAMETRVMSTARKLQRLEVSSRSMEDVRILEDENTFVKPYNTRYRDDEY